MISHGALSHNLRTIVRSLAATTETVVVSWLPQYHDMGLIGSVLGALYTGGSGVYMSPAAFVRRPTIWMEAVSKYRATHLQSPNFGLRLAARKWRETAAAGGGASARRLDLTSVLHIFNAAEPVTAAAVREFVATFSPFGLQPRAMCPGYGLAEHTVYVCDGAAPLLLRVSRDALAGVGDAKVPATGHALGGDRVGDDEGDREGAGSGSADSGGRVDILSLEALCDERGTVPSQDHAATAGPMPAAAAAVGVGNIVELVTLGPVWPHSATGDAAPKNPDIVVLIVDPSTRTVVPDGRLGEVWLASPSTASGYWGLPALSEDTFRARLSAPPPPPLALHRTGDDADGANKAATIAVPASPATPHRVTIPRPDLHATYAETRFLRTGDVGAIVCGGKLVLAGRSKDVVISRGRNYYPADVESALETAGAGVVRPGCVAVFQARLRRQLPRPPIACNTGSAASDATAVAVTPAVGSVAVGSPVDSEVKTSVDTVSATPLAAAGTSDAARAGNATSEALDEEEGAVAAVELRDANLPPPGPARDATLRDLTARLRAAALRDVGIRLSALVLLRPHGVVKTTSGKVARRWNARAWEALVDNSTNSSSNEDDELSKGGGVGAAPWWATVVSASETGSKSVWSMSARDGSAPSSPLLHVWRCASHASDEEPVDDGVDVATTGVATKAEFASLVGPELLSALQNEVRLLLRGGGGDTGPAELLPPPSRADGADADAGVASSAEVVEAGQSAVQSTINVSATIPLLDMGLDSLAMAQFSGMLAGRYGLDVTDEEMTSGEGGATLEWIVREASALRARSEVRRASALSGAPAAVAVAVPPPPHAPPRAVDEVGVAAPNVVRRKKATWWESNCPCFVCWCC